MFYKVEPIYPMIDVYRSSAESTFSMADRVVLPCKMRYNNLSKYPERVL